MFQWINFLFGDICTANVNVVIYLTDDTSWQCSKICEHGAFVILFVFPVADVNITKKNNVGRDNVCDFASRRRCDAEHHRRTRICKLKIDVCLCTRWKWCFSDTEQFPCSLSNAILSLECYSVMKKIYGNGLQTQVASIFYHMLHINLNFSDILVYI